MKLTDLGHETIGAGALLVFEDDVAVVVGDQVLESGVVAADLALGQSAGAQRVLRHVGHVLFEDERREFARTAPSVRTASRTARLARRRHHHQRHQRQPRTSPPPVTHFTPIQMQFHPVQLTIN